MDLTDKSTSSVEFSNWSKILWHSGPDECCDNGASSASSLL